jgi:hypothetical protein
MTSRSEGSSDEMSDVSLSRCREDISGKGAELSSPRRERMSWRITFASCGSLDVCSLSRAGMLFCPTYRVVSAASGSWRWSALHGGGADGAGVRTVCPEDYLAGLVALAPAFLLVRRVRSLPVMRAF